MPKRPGTSMGNVKSSFMDQPKDIKMPKQKASPPKMILMPKRKEPKKKEKPSTEGRTMNVEHLVTRKEDTHCQQERISDLMKLHPKDNRR